MSERRRILRNLKDRADDLAEAIEDFDRSGVYNSGKRRRKATAMAASVAIVTDDRHKSGNRALLHQLGLASKLSLPDTSKLTVDQKREATKGNGPLRVLTIENAGRDLTPKLICIGLIKTITPPMAKGKESLVFQAVPELVAIAPYVSLKNWLETDVGIGRRAFSRKKLTEYLRSKDGLGHVDPRIDDKKFDRLMGWSTDQIWYQHTIDGLALGTRWDTDGSDNYIHFTSRRRHPTRLSPSVTSGRFPILEGGYATMRQMAAELLHAVNQLDL